MLRKTCKSENGEGGQVKRCESESLDFIEFEVKVSKIKMLIEEEYEKERINEEKYKFV